MPGLFRLFFAVVALGCWISCGPSESRAIEGTDVADNVVPPTEVHVSLAVVKPFEYFIGATGKISSASEVQMQFRRSGLIEKVFVTNGQRVSKGTLLAVLDNKKQQLVLSRAKVMAEEKAIAYSDMMLAYRNKGDTAVYANISRNIRISSGLAAAEIALDEAKMEYESSFVRARISGVVSGLEVSAASVVGESDLLCYIHDPENLIVNTQVLEGDAMLLKRGAPAEVVPTALPDEVYPAVVEDIDPRVDEKTGLVNVLLRLGGKPRLFPGTHVRATLRLPYDDHIIVPKEALVIRSGRHVMFTVTNDLAKWKYVTIGRENGEELEILSGLHPGDTVIVTNNLQLAHDAPVKIVDYDQL